ncbi:MAG TPA: SDR family oxidoreductase [Gaiellaceae bacterium]|jgi:NAD(P)-dependent dehydrogenase (short-subunit alcohol dehydrogenase family)
MLSAELRGTALVTGGGRGIGANIARELAHAGMDVVVTGRTAEEVRAVADEVGGRALVGDVSKREDVARWCGDIGAVDLLVNNAGISGPDDPLGDVDAWWHTFEINVLGTYMCCRAFAPLMLERGDGRIVNVASGSAYLAPRDGPTSTAYPASKAAVHRFSEMLAASLSPQHVFVFSISPGLVRTAMTSWLGDDAPWTPPECAPRLVHALATGEFDALAGRYLHAEHDPPEQLRERMSAILADDVNAIRLRR